MNISIIIPNYNGQDLLAQNIPAVVKALQSYKGGKREIVIVDDASKDDSLNVLSELRQKYGSEKLIFTILKNKKNKGFSETVNKGVSHASGEIVILLNSDVFPHEDFLNSLLPHFTNPGVFAVGCAEENFEEGKIVIRGRGVGLWKRGLLMHRKGRNDKTRTLWVSGGSGAFRKSIWEKLDGLDPLFAPFYWEDIDLSYRALKAGYLVLFELESLVIHEHDKGAIQSGFKQQKITTTSYRNQFMFAWKNISDTTILVKHILWLPILILLSIKNGNFLLLSGLFEAISKLRVVLKARKKAQRQVRVSDRSVIKRVGLS